MYIVKEMTIRDVKRVSERSLEIKLGVKYRLVCI